MSELEVLDIIDDGQLIELVQQFPFLYSKEDPNFKNQAAKANAWKTISGIMGHEVTELITRWTVLRNRFTIELAKVRATPSGSDGSASESKWVWFSDMIFLQPHITPRKTKGNFLKSINKGEDSTRADPPSRSTTNTQATWNTVSTILDNESDYPSSGSTDGQEPASVTPKGAQKRVIATDSSHKNKKNKQNDPNKELASNISAAVSNIDAYLQNKNGDFSKSKEYQSPAMLFGRMVGEYLEKVSDTKKQIIMQKQILDIILEQID